jgi:methylaspartate mutase sigma subunit
VLENSIDADPERRRRVVVTGLSSDSHTWNLVFLQLYLEELGHEVISLGPCVPDELLVHECVRNQPDLVVLSSVNGHGHIDGRRVIGALRRRTELARMPIVIGGKLGVAGAPTAQEMQELITSGFDAVFDDSVGAGGFREFVESLPGERMTLCR